MEISQLRTLIIFFTDFLLPKFPEPPKGIPLAFPGNGDSKQMPPPTVKNGPGVSGNPNDDLDFDALARRFEELKKRM